MGGAGAFVLPAYGYEDFGRPCVRNLSFEVAASRTGHTVPRNDPISTLMAADRPTCAATVQTVPGLSCLTRRLHQISQARNVTLGPSQTSADSPQHSSAEWGEAVVTRSGVRSSAFDPKRTAQKRGKSRLSSWQRSASATALRYFSYLR